jgi:flagellar basal-body rod protein FlgC
MIPLLPGISSTSAALTAERVRMEVISQNIANVNTTRGLDGKPYQRQQVIFETILRQQQAGAGFVPQNVQIARIETDKRPPRMIFNPGHPDANPSSGLMPVPDINIHEEMADLIASSRSFEANLAVIRNARSMALQTLSIGKRV